MNVKLIFLKTSYIPFNFWTNLPNPKKCVNDRVILVCVSKKRRIIRKKWGYNKNITVTRAIVYALRSTCCTPRDYLIKCGHIFCAPPPPHYNLCLVTYHNFFFYRYVFVSSLCIRHVRQTWVVFGVFFCEKLRSLSHFIPCESQCRTTIMMPFSFYVCIRFIKC